MREPEMFEPMIDYLQRNGYTIIQVNRGKQLGPDILAERDDKKLIIQMKGDSEAIKTDWDTGLGQLLDMMDDPEKNYAIAVSEKYQRLVKSFPLYIKKKLELIFFIVKDDMTIVCF